MIHKDHTAKTGWVIVVLWTVIVALLSIMAGVAISQAANVPEEPGWDLVVYNDSDETIIFFLWWEDHPHKQIVPGPIQSFVAEMKPHTSTESMYKKTGKYYTVIFQYTHLTPGIDPVTQKIFVLDDCDQLTIIFDGYHIQVWEQFTKTPQKELIYE